MTQHLVLTVIGDDRPGLVGELSATISAHQGNWLESSMAQLAGKFAGIVEVSIDAAQADALSKALGELKGLKVTVETDFAPLYAQLEAMPDIAIADIVPGDEVITHGTQYYARAKGGMWVRFPYVSMDQKKSYISRGVSRP